MFFSKIRKILQRRKQMSQVSECEIKIPDCEPTQKDISLESAKPTLFKQKRDIFRFNGEKDISINLEHVTSMFLEGKRITFQFYQSQTFVDLEDEAAAKRALEQIIAVWSS
jgi:hypothetical protein